MVVEDFELKGTSIHNKAAEILLAAAAATTATLDG